MASAGSEEQKQNLLPQIVSGEKIYAFAYQEFSRFFKPEHIKLSADSDGDNYKLNGSKLFVEFADGADTLLVAARTGEDDQVILQIFNFSLKGMVQQFGPFLGLSTEVGTSDR